MKSREVNLKLPKLKGKNIEEHFFNIAHEQVEPYEGLIKSIVNTPLPDIPKVRNQISQYFKNVKIKF